jgi:hypothetical protein
VRNDAHATAKVAPFPVSPHEHHSNQLTRSGDAGTLAPADPLMDFASEDDIEAGLVPSPPVEPAPVVKPRRPIRWTPVALTALALVVGGQGIAMYVWMRPQATPPLEGGAVSITSEPPGSPVTIDGVSRGVTPVTLTLGAGAHRVEVGQGADVRVQTVNVARGGEASVHLDLPKPATSSTPALGGLQVGEPAGARVWIDGQLRGTVPLAVSDLAPGVRAVRILTAGGTLINRSVTVEAGVTASLIVSLGPRAQAASGWISITSSIAAQIYEDGTLVGSTDTPRIMVPAGAHSYEFVNRALGFRASRDLQVAAGQTAALTLDVPRGSVNINALPWANVWIDGRAAGETPLANVALPLGNHELVFRHPELGEHRRTVVVTAGAPVRVGVDLRKGQQ